MIVKRLLFRASYNVSRLVLMLKQALRREYGEQRKRKQAKCGHTIQVNRQREGDIETK